MTRERRLIKAIEETFDEFYSSCDLESAQEYAEPGYKLKRGQRAILFANWNDEHYLTAKMLKLLEPSFKGLSEKEILDCIDRHYAIEWEDEWMTCSDCGRAIRQKSDSYYWRASYHIHDGEVNCLDCIDYAQILGDFINTPDRAWLFDTKYLESAGFKALADEDFHGGIREISEDPSKIYEKLKAKSSDDIVFVIDTVEQFGVKVKVYSRAKE